MAKKSKKIIVCLYYTIRGIYPLRVSIKDHLYSFKNYSQHKIVYVNTVFGFPWKFLQYMEIDGIIFHTSFLSIRWSPSLFCKLISDVRPLKFLTCPKIALPQDEFLHTNILEDFLEELGITHIYSCASPSEWPKIYPRLSDKKNIHFYQVLTGYLHPKTVRTVLKLKQSIEKKGAKGSIDIGYRAWKAAYWLGEHGRYKAEIAERTEDLAQDLNLTTDISLKDTDTFHGMKWFEFLIKCQATIGVEGGASILDRDGSLKEKTETYLKEHPDASFEEVKKAIFAKEDNTLALFALSPRHLEACLSGTYQILIEGDYNGILKPFVHYYPVKKDYSNLKDALLSLKQKKNKEKMIQAAFQDIILSEKYTYKNFISLIDGTAFFFEEGKKNFLKNYLFRQILNLREHFIWYKIRQEVYVESLKTFLKKSIRWIQAYSRQLG